MINKENVLKAIKADTNNENTINACNFVLAHLSSEIAFDDYKDELNDILIDNSDELCKLYGTTNEEDLEDLGNYIESFIVEELEKPFYQITRFEININKRWTRDELIEDFKKGNYDGDIIDMFTSKEEAMKELNGYENNGLNYDCYHKNYTYYVYELYQLNNYGFGSSIAYACDGYYKPEDEDEEEE